MVVLSIREIAERAGFKNPSTLAEKTGIPYASMHRIWNGSATRVDLKTLDKLCEILEVRPGQLFSHTFNSDKTRK